ncbi:MAG: ribonuclease Z [Candidatus Bipolaricaulis sp.]|nr:ribonuclease Z [Candidatus Bipolaricaulis sp.]
MRREGWLRRGGRVGRRVPILCLGSSAALTDGGPWSSLLVDGRVLLEIPPTTVPQLHRYRLDPSRIDWLFVSHLHADHVFGLPFLLLEFFIRHERSSPLTLIGPSGLTDYVHALCDLAWRGLCTGGPERLMPLAFVEATAGQETAVGPLRFVAFPMVHFGLPALGYRISYRGRKIAYSGDTGPCPGLDALLEGADVAIVEMTHPHPTEDEGHLDAADVARLAAPLAARGAKVLATHMTGRPRRIPGVTFCRPGRTYRV